MGNHMRVADTYESFLTYCQADRQVGLATLAKYRDCFKTWILPWFGEKELADLNLLDILGLKKAMVEKKLSAARQYSVIMCLKSFLKFCRRDLGVLSLDPADVRLPKREAPNVVYLTNEELQKLLDSIEISTFTGSRLRALIELLLSTGMRISEALALTREPFDVGQSELQIVGKGKRQRSVFFSPRCRYWVKQYLDRRVDDRPALFITTGFPVRPLKREDISRFFRNLKAKAQITKKFTPHVLRHTFCTNLLFNGADITHIKDLAGHQDIDTTARYYLGKDNAVLRQVHERFLNYELAGRNQTTRDAARTSVV